MSNRQAQPAHPERREPSRNAVLRSQHALTDQELADWHARCSGRPAGSALEEGAPAHQENPGGRGVAGES